MRLLVNGKLQPDSSLLPFSNSLIRGDGLFETILTIDEKPVAWGRHYARLEKAAKRLLFTLPARIDIELGIGEILLGAVGQSRMRLNVLAEGDWFITLEPVTPSDEAISLMRAELPKISNGQLSGIKSISYGESMLAVRKAQEIGYTDSIFVNENGFVVETGMSNILILSDDGWLTPALTTGCLPGVTRELLIKWFEIKEDLFTYEQLLAATAVYTCSSIRLIQRVGKVDDRLFAESSLGNELIGKFEMQLFSNIAP